MLHTLLHDVLPVFRPWQALSHGPAGDAAVGGVTLSPSTMAVAQGPSLAAASGTTVPGTLQPHILIASHTHILSHTHYMAGDLNLSYLGYL